MTRVYIGEDSTASYLDAEQLVVGDAILPRSLVHSNSAVTCVSANLRLTYFTARKTQMSTQARMVSGSTAAAATPTLVRWGLYQIGQAADGSTLATLVAAIANDTTLFAAANTVYTRSWTTPVQLFEGQRYAFGIVVVSGAAVPTLIGHTLGGGSPGFNADVLATPTLAATLSASDLPATITASQVAGLAGRFYAVLLP